MRHLLGAALCALCAAETAAEMTVAVLEHRVRQRPTAVEMMEANLEVYEQQLQAAAAAGAQLLVTPEDGITGFRMQREAWWPYAFDLPPAPMDQPPCDANRGHGASVPWVLQRLSCMAREHQVALVASLIDLKDCSKQPDYPGCPVPSRRDGKLLLNTAVVLDRDGCFLQKYHKANLWYEAALDASKECSPKTFRIKGFESVPFGLFICADLIHAWPSLELVTQGIRHFVMPLSWSNEMAQMQPMGWQQAWSSLSQSVLLAANTRADDTSGSGIYVAGEPKSTAYALNGTEGQLLLAQVPLQLPGHPAGCPAKAAEAVQEVGKWEVAQLDMTPGDHSRLLCSAGLATCCRLRYRSLRAGAGYAVALLNGLDVSPQVAPWAAEACSILPCEGGGLSCLTYPAEALRSRGAQWFGEFDFVEMEVNFSAPQQVFPQVLTEKARLVSPSEWHLESPQPWSRRIFVEHQELISLQLYGRPYWKDSDAQEHCPCRADLPSFQI
ncbi:Pantetheinase (Pantetheine hydrolase) (Tiff66) (Vascular non-inflammatory molecule 1) (Vanin-1) [Durusdinium trenchii]|uniref:Pantetheinase (Pantetheine hydrolase) (Tiff66) (Vascular non-inflammatory molecule 1) (Vanin-1) n=2 Tax=Durusdinium trenchii TaxID=1381693 RepID=A0ABP0S761_9DINO